MIDITPFLDQASARYSEKWNHQRVREALMVLASGNASAEIDWEPFDENWGRVIQGSEFLGIVSAQVPLAIVTKAISDVYDFPFEEFEWVVVSVPSFHERCLQVDKLKLEKIIGRQLTDGVNYMCISALDLWWATI